MTSRSNRSSSMEELSPYSIASPVVVIVSDVLMSDAPLVEQPWHSPSHAGTRDTIQQCINHLIMQRRPNGNQEWVEKLPEISSRLEQRLYARAKSLEEYSDPYTLIKRIQKMVKNFIIDATSKDPYSFESAASSQPPPSQVKAEPLSETNINTAVHENNSTQEIKYSEEIKKTSGNSKNSGEKLIKTQIKVNDVDDSSLNVNTTGNTPRQVSSQGCSRVFIIKVLVSVSDLVKGKSLPSIFTFSKDLVMQWLLNAKEECTVPTHLIEEGYYGGPPFFENDASTHWTDPNQLYTWWKNNVERRSKFKVLQLDALYTGLDSRRLQRARWCEGIVSLAEIIRASAGSSSSGRSSASLTQENKIIPPISEAILPPVDPSLLVPGFTLPTANNLYLNNPTPVSPNMPTPGSTPIESGLRDSEETQEGEESTLGSGIYRSLGQTFPLKLYDLVSSEAETALAWCDDGKSFQVRDFNHFVRVVLPKHFKHNNFTSFQRQLNLYGFRRSLKCDKGTYHHPQFRRNHRALVESIRRELNPTSTSAPISTSIPADAATLGSLKLNYPISNPNGEPPGTPSGAFTPMSEQEGTPNPALNFSLPSAAGMPPGGLFPMNPVNPLFGSAGFGGYPSLMNFPPMSMSYPFVPPNTLGAGNPGSFPLPSSMDLQGFNPYTSSETNPLSEQQIRENNYLAILQHEYFFMLQHHHNQEMLRRAAAGNDPRIRPSGANFTNPLTDLSSNRFSGKDTGSRRRPSLLAGRKKPGKGETPGQGEESEDPETVLFSSGLGKSKKPRGDSQERGNARVKKLKTSISLGSTKDHDLSTVHRLLKAHETGVSKVNKGENKEILGGVSGLKDRRMREKRGHGLISSEELLKVGSRERLDDWLQQTGGESIDLLDLRKPKKKRVFLDFTVGRNEVNKVGTDSTETEEKDKNTENNNTPPNYSFGIYHGKLKHGEINPDIIRLKNYSLRERNSKDNESVFLDDSHKSIRIGEEYQTIIPDMLLNSTSSVTNTENLNEENMVWKSNEISDELISSFITAVKKKLSTEILRTPGSLIVLKPTSTSPGRSEKILHKLCSILGSDSSETDLNFQIKVFDGNKIFTVGSEDCYCMSEIVTENILQYVLLNHQSIEKDFNGNVEHFFNTLDVKFCGDYCKKSDYLSDDNLNTEVDENIEGSLQNKRDLSDFGWTVDEVQFFCSNVRRFGDNARKIWLKFASDDEMKNKRNLHEIVDFFHRIYPHAQATGGSKRLVRIYEAINGFSDEEEEMEETIITNNEVEDDMDTDMVEGQSGNYQEDSEVSSKLSAKSSEKEKNEQIKSLIEE